jgi:hypothetical protein
MHGSQKDRFYSELLCRMAAQGTAVAAGTAELAFRTWFNAAVAAVGSNSSWSFVVLKQPITSVVITFDSLKPRVAGTKMELWWGDGLSDEYTGDSAPTHTYSIAGVYGVVILGSLKTVYSNSNPGTDFGGNISTWRYLDDLSIGQAYNTCSGNLALIAGVTLSGVSITGLHTCTNFTALVQNSPGISYWIVANMSTADVNGVLAALRANKDEPKPSNSRFIHLGLATCEAPTGQGILDAEYLRTYRSPNDDPTKDLWTVYTN